MPMPSLDTKKSKEESRVVADKEDSVGGDSERIQPEKTLFSWKAPARPFKRRDREFYVTLIAIVGIVGLVLFLAEGFMPVILLSSLVFLFYVLNTVEPETIEYQITSQGIKIADKDTLWPYLTRFWFSRRYDDNLLILETSLIPGRIELVINHSDRQALKEILVKYLKEEVAPPSFLDKAANWFSKKLPGNQ